MTKTEIHPLPSKPIEIGTFDGFVRAGFPMPDGAHVEKRIDLMDELCLHSGSTIQLRVRGESMRDVGIGDGDFILVDRAIVPRHGDIVVAQIDQDYTVKTLHLDRGRARLVAANPEFPDIEIKDEQTLQIWGVVVAAIKPFRT